VDELHFAETTSPEIAQGIASIRNKFVNFLEREHPGVQRIPITPGMTAFDAKLGHAAVLMEYDPALPEDVILRVIRDGYTYRNLILREAQVVVNRYTDNDHE
jgi:molecular chaperone GrpE (heat shock protein)